MIQLIERLTLLALMIGIAVLVGTSLPTWWGEHLLGNRLLIHMMGSGVVVVTLPLYGFLRWSRWLAGKERKHGEPTAFWLMMVTGFFTIATMFASMLPLPSTDMLRTLSELHGWVGYALALAAIWTLVALLSRKSSSVG